MHPSETGSSPETPMRGKIMLPTEFDLKRRIIPGFATRIAGCSCFSLDHIMRSLEAGKILNYTEAEGNILNIQLEDATYQSVFGEPAFVHGQQGWIEENRRGWGVGWATYQLAKETGISQKLHNSDWRDNLPALVLMTQKRGVSSAVVNRYFSAISPEGRVRADFLQAFDTEQNLLFFLKQMLERKGVQVVFGDRTSFAQFVTQAPHVPTDDRGVELPIPIPNRLVLAILPLGKWEQREIQKHV